jgi:hypothetical protein
MQSAGLEWLYRMAQEPRRLAKRYLVHDLPFALRLFARAALVRRRGRQSPAGGVELPPEPVVFTHGAAERERAKLLEDLLRPPD